MSGYSSLDSIWNILGIPCFRRDLLIDITGGCDGGLQLRWSRRIDSLASGGISWSVSPLGLYAVEGGCKRCGSLAVDVGGRGGEEGGYNGAAVNCQLGHS